jgi:hypothetical protein
VSLQHSDSTEGSVCLSYEIPSDTGANDAVTYYSRVKDPSSGTHRGPITIIGRSLDRVSIRMIHQEDHSDGPAALRQPHVTRRRNYHSDVQDRDVLWDLQRSRDPKSSTN